MNSKEGAMAVPCICLFVGDAEIRIAITVAPGRVLRPVVTEIRDAQK
jgi:hypothetical protein